MLRAMNARYRARRLPFDVPELAVARAPPEGGGSWLGAWSARVMVVQVVAAGSLWGSGLPRVWGFGRNALVAGWEAGRLTG